MMSTSPMNPHPQDDELMRYADGEMPARQARKIRSHLEACWQCRAGLEDMQKVISDCVRYRKDLLQIYLPSPPARWGDIHQGFAEIDASRNDVPLFLRIRDSLRLRLAAAPRWAAAALAVVLVGVLSIELLQTPSVQAAELLRKAAAAAEARPAKPRLIQIKTSKHQITRRLNAAVNASSAEAQSEIQALFRTARYNWNDPLTVRSYQDWRDGLSDKRDEVTTVTDQNVYRIHTSSAAGEIAEATLTLRILDLQPIQERFEFRDREWMEISELPEDAAPVSEAIAGSPFSPPTTRRAAPASAAVRITEATPGQKLGEELQVLATLHRLGADLGDPVEVKRERNQILVEGVGIAPGRQEQIHQALDAVPNVVVRFSEPAAAAGGNVQPAPVPLPSAKSVNQPFQARIEQQIGGRQNFEQFSSQLLDMSDSMMSHAYALRRLSDRFSRDLEASLSPADRKVLQDLNGEHAAAIQQQAAQMERLLKPVLVPLGAIPVAGTASKIRSVAWQPASEELFQSGRNVETLVAVMLGVTPGVSSAQLPTEVLLGVGQLRAVGQPDFAAGGR
ncbi:MAG: zf-HC2 domain-containing protein, partial [Bryobacteraceae bacterium]